MKEIWIPKSETKVQVTEDGKVTIWQDMMMELKPITRPKPGFNDGKRD